MFEEPKRMTMMDDRLMRLGDLQAAAPDQNPSDSSCEAPAQASLTPDHVSTRRTVLVAEALRF